MFDVTMLFNAAPARYPELRGQVAIVTGGSRRIGLAIAARLGREGMRLLVSGLDAAETEGAAAGLRALGVEAAPFVGDLRDRATGDALIDLALATYGDLHLLVNNAADLRRVPSDQLSDELIESELALNFASPMWLALRAVAIMRQRRAADSDVRRADSVVNISSVGGLRSHYPGMPYAMTKGALDALTRTLAVDIAAHGVRVNGVAPGWTPMYPDPDEYAAQLAAKAPYVPMRRPGHPLDIGAAVAFLASDDAAYITGQTLYVDGGLTTQLHPPEHPI